MIDRKNNRSSSMRFHSRNARGRRSVFGWLALLLCGGAAADDVTGSDSLLCYAHSAARCEVEEGTCEVKTPWQLNLPDFLKLDLDAKRAETTEASGEVRQTELRTVERSNGVILLQGIQGERAFSWLISETTGEGTLAVSALAAGLTVFTVCTPIDKL
jgi:hypothetical protein